MEGVKRDGGDVMWRAAMVAAEGEEGDKKGSGKDERWPMAARYDAESLVSLSPLSYSAQLA